jgi:hypothetical protein
VSELDNGEGLAHRRTVAVVVRLVLDAGGELVHGEVVAKSGYVHARFVAWEALVPAVRAWLEREDEE